MNRAIPIASAKEDPDLLDRAMDQVAEALEAGELVGIFPEGRLTADGKIGPFRKGVERIVARTRCRLYPWHYTASGAVCSAITAIAGVAASIACCGPSPCMSGSRSLPMPCQRTMPANRSAACWQAQTEAHSPNNNRGSSPKEKRIMKRTHVTWLIALFIGNGLLFGASLLVIGSILNLSLDMQTLLGTSLLAGALVTGYNVFLLRMKSGLEE